jgi:hypothetical protein
MILAFACLLAASQQGPIHFTAEFHADPLRDEPNATLRRAEYEDWVQWTNDTLDQIDPAVRVSFLMSGEFAEYVLDDGAGGVGAQLLQRMYALGGHLGVHFHNEYRTGAHAWDVLGGAYTLDDARRCWTDNVEQVDEAARLALGLPSGTDVRDVVNGIGAHVPVNVGPDYYTLMQEFGFRVRQPGPLEIAYEYFSHYPYHPVQSSDTNALVEDRAEHFVTLPAGPGIGRAPSWHNGTFADFSLPAAQAMFLVELLNWRHALRNGGDERVWTFGIVTQSQYQEPGHEEEIGWKGMLQWIRAEIEPLETLAGREIVEYASEYEVALEYRDWRVSHPAEVSFSYAATTTDWNEYPWLVAPARELAGARYVARTDLGDARAFVWEMTLADGRSAALCWREGQDAAEDLTAIFGPFSVRIVDVETDTVTIGPAASVVLGREPVVVTAR